MRSPTGSRPSFRKAGAAALAAFLTASPALAQRPAARAQPAGHAAVAGAAADTAPADTAPADTAAVDTAAVDTAAVDTAPAAPAVRGASRLTVHGYVTQGFAGLHGGVQFYGVRGRTSGDFRYAALQGRYALTGADHVVLQVNHRRLGDSPITGHESEVRANWAYYEHAFRDGTAVKAGRSPIPRGIYNQLRSVGVALPTYRPPVVFYDEGAYYSETIDGVVASRTFREDAAWSLEAHAYAGQWESLAYDTWSDEYAVERVHARRAVGGQLWLNTPVDGVRLGAAAQRYAVNEEVMETSEMKEYHLSAEVTRERGFFRAEAQVQLYGVSEFYSGYAQLGARLAGKLHGVVEVQRSLEAGVEYGDGTLPSSYMWHRSDGVGLSYAFAPTLVAKVEHHWDRGIQLEQPGNPMNPRRFRYVIASLSASF